MLIVNKAESGPSHRVHTVEFQRLGVVVFRMLVGLKLFKNIAQVPVTLILHLKVFLDHGLRKSGRLQDVEVDFHCCRVIFVLLAAPGLFKSCFELFVDELLCHGRVACTLLNLLLDRVSEGYD